MFTAISNLLTCQGLRRDRWSLSKGKSVNSKSRCRKQRPGNAYPRPRRFIPGEKPDSRAERGPDKANGHIYGVKPVARLRDKRIYPALIGYMDALHRKVEQDDPRDHSHYGIGPYIQQHKGQQQQTEAVPDGDAGIPFVGRSAHEWGRKGACRCCKSKKPDQIAVEMEGRPGKM